MDHITLIAVLGAVVAALSWLARFFGWFGGHRRREGEDSSAATQGSAFTPANGAVHHGSNHDSGGTSSFGDLGGGHHG